MTFLNWDGRSSAIENSVIHFTQADFFHFAELSHMVFLEICFSDQALSHDVQAPELLELLFAKGMYSYFL